MPSKLQFYTQMSDHTARQITGSFGEWTAFLETAGRLYADEYERTEYFAAVNKGTLFAFAIDGKETGTFTL